MAYRTKRGLGASPPGVYDCSGSLSWYLSSSCWGKSPEQWAAVYSAQMSPVAPPQAPTGPALTTAPASGADAQASVDAIVNQQLIDQQAKNAAGVTSSTTDLILGSGGSAIDAAGNLIPIPSTTNWLLYGGIAIAAVFGITLLAGRAR